MTGEERSNWTMAHDGDSAVVVSFEPRIDPVISGRCVAIADAVRTARLVGVRDVVEGYATVTVHLDPVQVTTKGVAESIRQIVDTAPAASAGEQRTTRETDLPVCYGGRHGPDLADVAAFGQCTEADVIRRHTEVTYRVYMLGFLPGFAYLGTVDARIAAPRRQTPRVKVLAGSVGIAGPQTGVYPSESPGGWQIIGRCPVRLCDWAQEPPFLLRAGDCVRFEPIDEVTYERLQAGRS